jgi:hypothetical protein
MKAARPDHEDEDVTTDSATSVFIVATGPVDLTVRPMNPRHLRQPPAPGAPERGVPEHGPEPK